MEIVGGAHEEIQNWLDVVEAGEAKDAVAVTVAVTVEGVAGAEARAMR